MDAIESNVQALNFTAILIFYYGNNHGIQGHTGGTADQGFFS